uniref:CCHC-type domain-containing protein n=1 Tax=Fagus sylvatica TaxID=28930 RepID=A0A2N9FQX7_FAGSY
MARVSLQEDEEQIVARNHGQQPWQSKNVPYASTSSNVATKSTIVSKPTTFNSSFQSYKCGEQGHKANECKKSGLQVKNKALMVESMEEGVVDQEIDVKDAVEDIGGDSEGEEEVVDKLRLQQKDHPNPYKLSWLKKGNDVKVTTRCLVSFSIRKKFQDVVMCDVVKMDALSPITWQTVRLGKNGVEEVLGLGSLSDYEKENLESLKPELKSSIEKGIKWKYCVLESIASVCETCGSWDMYTLKRLRNGHGHRVKADVASPYEALLVPFLWHLLHHLSSSTWKTLYNSDPWEDTMDCKSNYGLDLMVVATIENHERRIETWEGHEAIVLGAREHHVPAHTKARAQLMSLLDTYRRLLLLEVVHDVKVKDDGYGELASPDWGEPRVIDELHPSRLGLGDVGCGGGRSCQDLRLSARLKKLQMLE